MDFGYLLQPIDQVGHPFSDHLGQLDAIVASKIISQNCMDKQPIKPQTTQQPALQIPPVATQLPPPPKSKCPCGR